MHCVGQPAQEVNASSCDPDAASPASGVDADASSAALSADDGGSGDGGETSDDECAYGATMFGQGSADGGGAGGEGDDDDCKYHVVWTSSPICPSATIGVIFTVTVTNLTTGLPVTDLPPAEGILPEAFIPTSLDASCDTMTTHFSPTPFGSAHLFQTSATSGTYVGSVVFDQSGEWTVRFHIHEECDDSLADSPHGHAAFHITVPAVP